MTENNNIIDKDKEPEIDGSENIESSGENQPRNIDQPVKDEKKSPQIDGSENNESSGEDQPGNINKPVKVEKKAPRSVSVVGVRFRSCGKVYTFEVGNLEVSPGTKVVVDSKMGLSMGNVVTSKHLMERK